MSFRRLGKQPRREELEDSGFYLFNDGTYYDPRDGEFRPYDTRDPWETDEHTEDAASDSERTSPSKYDRHRRWMLDVMQATDKWHLG